MASSNVSGVIVDSSDPAQRGEYPGHVVVVKYLPYVGDSVCAMNEYTSEIFMGSKNAIVMHNTCEDSSRATPIICDLCILAVIAQRIEI